MNVVKLENNTADERLNYAGWSFYGKGYYGMFPGIPVQGRSGAYTSFKDASAEFRTRRGTVTWKTVKHPDAGITDVYENGEKVETFDAYAPSTEFDVTGYQFESSGSWDTLRLVNTGTKNPESSGTFIDIDRFEVDDGGDIDKYFVRDSRISYGSWKDLSNFGPSGNSYRVSSSPTSPLLIGPVYGSKFDLVTGMGPGLGTMLVEVYSGHGPGWPDGGKLVTRALFNLESATTSWQVVRTVAGLDDEGIANRPYTVTIASYDGRPVIFDAIMFDSLLGSYRSLRSLNYTSRCIRRLWKDDLGYAEGYLSEISTEQDRQDATFKIVPGLADRRRGVSFESAPHPSHYLRHQDYQLKLHKYSEDQLFKEDATFSIVDSLAPPSIAGWSSGVSFRSFNYPERYIRHTDFYLRVESGSSDLFRKDASFRIELPMWQPTG